MPYSVTPTLGIDLSKVYTALDIAAGDVKVPHKLGQQVFGDDGRLHVFVVTGVGGIAAAQTDVTVSASTFAATDGSGSYTGPAGAVLEGDYFWASKASV
jgi:hypothetical protein